MKRLCLVGLLGLLSPVVRAGVWDATTPTGSEAITQGDDRIREMKTAIAESLNRSTSGVFPGTNPATAPMFQWTLDYGLDADKPISSVQVGQVYVATGVFKLDVYDGSSWVTLLSTSIIAPSVIAHAFPTGTKMPFYQTACPSGWTAVSVTTNSFVRVVSTGSTGGTAGGTTPASTSLANHTHNSTHTHTTPNHRHDIQTQSVSDANAGKLAEYLVLDTGPTSPVAVRDDGGATSADVLEGRTENSGSGTSGAASSSNTGGVSSGDIADFMRLDMIICSKD